MHHITRQAFSLSETLITISLIGILAVTMLTLNQISSNDYRIAQTKMNQTEQWIRAWGKTLSYSNETGLGAVYVIQDQESLINSLTEYFQANKLSDADNVTFVDITGESHETFDNIRLNNGTIIKVDYNLTGDDVIMHGGVPIKRNHYNSALATIRIDVPVEGNNTITSEFDLKGSGKIQESYKRWQ